MVIRQYIYCEYCHHGTAIVIFNHLSCAVEPIIKKTNKKTTVIYLYVTKRLFDQ